MIQAFGKSCTLRNHSFIFVSSEPFCLLCHDPKSIYGAIPFPLTNWTRQIFSAEHESVPGVAR